MSKSGMVIAGLGFLLAATQVNAGELECRSSGYHYQYCPADTWNNVQLARKLSNASCDYGRGWGYDQRGIWVDNGCAGMFNYGGGDRHGYDGHSHGHGHGGDVAAGVAAAVILGAMINAGNDHHGNDRGRYHDDHDYQDNGGYHGRDDGHRDDGGGYGVNVPAWAVGHFAGSDREGGPDIEIAIDPDGRINGMQGSRMFDGQMRGTQAWLGNRSYGVVRSGNGIRLVSEGHGGYDLYRE